jgi:hypothetical protein
MHCGVTRRARAVNNYKAELMINAQCTRINSVRSTDVADPTTTVRVEAPSTNLIGTDIVRVQTFCI